MKNCIVSSLLLISILSVVKSDCQEERHDLGIKVFVIPEENNLGTTSGYVRKVTGLNNICKVETPLPQNNPPEKPDLGQEKCMKHLHDALEGNKEEFIIYANSQGTATALNFFSDPQNKELALLCKGLVLESVLASGNSAIYHTITTAVPPLKKIPGLYYLAPYFAKVLFPSYSPTGQQPIKCIKDFNINGPVIIFHSKNDFQLSYDDACAIYYALQHKHKKDAYLIPHDSDNHMNIFATASQEDHSSVIKKLEHHNIKKPSDIQQNLKESEYQPGTKLAHLRSYENLLQKESRMKYAGRGLQLALISTVALIGFKIMKYLKIIPLHSYSSA